MRRIVIVTSAGALAFLSAGCSYFSFLPWVDNPEDLEGTGIVEEAPSPEASPIVEEFADPLEAGGQPSVAGLLQPTNPNERIRQVQKGREDPFAVVPVQPILIPKESPPVASLPKSPQMGDGGAGQSRITASKFPQAGGTEPAQAVRTPETTLSSPPPSAQERRIPGFGLGQQVLGEEGLQTPSQPAVASAIAVSGVIQVGTAPKAIIKAPNEEYSRYVQPGDYVANGQVLVKRIETRSGPSPTVVFEENGIELARQVGAGVQGETAAETPTAFVARSSGDI